MKWRGASEGEHFDFRRPPQMAVIFKILEHKFDSSRITLWGGKLVVGSQALKGKTTKLIALIQSTEVYGGPLGKSRMESAWSVRTTFGNKRRKWEIYTVWEERRIVFLPQILSWVPDL